MKFFVIQSLFQEAFPHLTYVDTVLLSMEAIPCPTKDLLCFLMPLYLG